MTNMFYYNLESRHPWPESNPSILVIKQGSHNGPEARSESIISCRRGEDITMPITLKKNQHKLIFGAVANNDLTYASMCEKNQKTRPQRWLGREILTPLKASPWAMIK